MAWIVQNRLQPYQPTRTEPYITPKIRDEIVNKYFPRYPTKQAALLPLFHLIMHEYGLTAPQAIDEGGPRLGISPAEGLGGGPAVAFPRRGGGRRVVLRGIPLRAQRQVRGDRVLPHLRLARLSRKN